MTASQMFGVPVEGMDPMIRRRLRRQFGVIYGISGYGLARNLASRRPRRAFIDMYFQRFPEIRAYMDRTAGPRRRVCAHAVRQRIHAGISSSGQPRARAVPRQRADSHYDIIRAP